MFDLFRGKKETKAEVKEEPQPPKHWAVPIFEELLTIAEEQPHRYYPQSGNNTSVVRLVGKPEFQLRVDSDGESYIMAPERITLPHSEVKLSYKLGKKVQGIFSSENSEFAGMFSQWLNSEDITLIRTPKTWNEEMHLALQKAQGTVFRGSSFIWFRNKKDASLFKLTVSEEG